ncbi:hypothetical protein [Leadbetterella byssophila]|uniref:hypothetical protein n=1 Tax=Leadbetterella byssophila TaxID=316068 RepID=UPI0039A002F2
MEEQLQILKRTIQAMDQLVNSGAVRGINTVCNEAGVHGTKYREVRSKLRKGAMPRYFKADPVVLSHLVKSYNISAHWLLTGIGSMQVK